MNSNQSSSIGLNDFWAKAHLHFLKLDRYGVHSDIDIIRIMRSVILGPKVITLSGFHRIWSLQ